MQLSSRGKFYSTFKENLCFEKYLIKIPYNLKIWITKLRTSNLKIPIETGRWHNIPVEERICNMCNANIGDEFHYLFICKSQELVKIRENLIPEYYTTLYHLYTRNSDHCSKHRIIFHIHNM